MAPPDTPAQSDSSTPNTPIATPSPIPPPVPVETHPNRGQFRPPSRANTDQARLTPEDAYRSPPKLRPLHEINGLDSAAASAAAAALRPAVASLRAPPAIPPVAARIERERKRNASRKRRQQPHVWKKLLWIKQPGFPDNHTDTETFLDHMQHNPTPRLYDFWPLVADSTVIVQHVCSVAIFVSAYAGIYQDRLSPVTVVTWGSVATIIGWIMWDQWMGQEEAEIRRAWDKAIDDAQISSSSTWSAPTPPSEVNGRINGVSHEQANGHSKGSVPSKGLGLSLSTSNLSTVAGPGNGHATHGQSLSRSSFQSISPIELDSSATASLRQSTSAKSRPPNPYSPTTLSSSVSHRNQVRLKTFKSALLIYFALLGLSPILKSLTKSTSSDSIWALATWLLIINIFFFDYGSSYAPQHRSRTAATTNPFTESSAGTEKTQNRLRAMSTATPAGQSAGSIKGYSAPPFPSSLSTNAALMASTVLASRLPTTTSVFSLSLFSIQVFGLFPVFRRHLRYKSGDLHTILTILLITMASCGLFLILSRSYTHTYGDCGYCWGWIWHVTIRSTAGIILGGSAIMFVMGACSWWLISLQKYKNVLIGPWDPARPVLAGGVPLHGRGRGGTD